MNRPKRAKARTVLCTSGECRQIPFMALVAVSVLTFAVVYLSSSFAYANEHLLGGRAFTPPSQTIPMGEDWDKQGIHHKTPQPVDLAVALDQQLYPALGPMIEQFAKDNGVRIAVQNGTCGVSAGLLAEKAADMGGFCCPPAITDRLPGLKYHTIGIGALALIANPDNPTTNVSVESARKLFGDGIRDWSELPMSGFKPGTKEPVRAIARLHCKVRPGHWRLILDNEQHFAWDLTEVSSIKDMIQQVSMIPGSIGYETLWHIGRQTTDDPDRVKTLHVDGASPRDNGALARGAYPLYRVFNITTWAQNPAHSELNDRLAEHLIAKADDIPPEYAIVPVSELRRHGWKFEGNEVIREPR